MKKKTEKTDWTKKFNKALEDWGKLSKEAQLSSIITVFLWFWYLFIGRKQIEAWKVLLVNVLLLFGIVTSTNKLKKKRGKKDGKKKQ